MYDNKPPAPPERREQKGVEFDTFKNEAGSNSFTLTPLPRQK